MGPPERARDGVVQDMDAGQRLGDREDQRARGTRPHVKLRRGGEILVAADVDPREQVGAGEFHDVDPARLDALGHATPSLISARSAQPQWAKTSMSEDMDATRPPPTGA